MNDDNYTKTLERWRKKYANYRRFSFSLRDAPRPGDFSICIGFSGYAIQIINGVDNIVMYNQHST